jgi:GNAT superfamily N-acetyltransferase
MKKTPHHLRVRDAQPEDVPGLAAVGHSESSAIHLDRIQDAAEHNVRYLVAESRGTILGYGLLVLERPPAWPDTSPTDYLPLIIDLHVAEESRGRGIGTRMIGRMELIARRAGYKELYMTVDPVENLRALALYIRLGYVPVQTEPYLTNWHFEDSSGFVHEGVMWAIAVRKRL